MNTAEVTIDQVLAGIFGLLLCLAPFVEPSARCLVDSTVGSAALLALAYLVGAVFDKVFDSALARIEQWQRLDLARKRAKASVKDDEVPKERDWFDQAKLEHALRSQEGATAWLNHLRTRLRLSRTLAIAAPLVPLALASALQSGRPWVGCEVASPGLPFYYPEGEGWWLAASPVVLLVASVAAAQPSDALRTDKWKYGQPRTARQLKDLEARAWLPLAILYGGAALIGALQIPSSSWGLLAGGLAFGLVSLWTWSRLLKTYMRFVLDSEPPSTESLKEPAA
jgi:hypothetical protein